MTMTTTASWWEPPPPLIILCMQRSIISGSLAMWGTRRSQAVSICLPPRERSLKTQQTQQTRPI